MAFKSKARRGSSSRGRSGSRWRRGRLIRRSNSRYVVAFKDRPGVGVELRDVGLIPKEHLKLTLDVCAKNGLDGFVDYAPGLDMQALTTHVAQGGALVTFPTAGRLWVVQEE